MLIKTKYNYVLGLKKSEFEFFLIKFYGSLVSRGRKSYAIKLFNRVLIDFKIKFKTDPFVELNKAIDNLIPILMSTQKKVGKVYQAVPKLAVGNRRFVIILNWVIKKQKGKSNTLGLKINDVSRNLIDAVDKKGLLINLKKQHLSSVLANKHLLYSNRRRSFFKWKSSNLTQKRVQRKFFYRTRKYKYTRRRLNFLKKNKLLFNVGELIEN